MIVLRYAIAVVFVFIFSPLTISAGEHKILFREDFNDLTNWEPLYFPKIEKHSSYKADYNGRMKNQNLLIVSPGKYHGNKIYSWYLLQNIITGHHDIYQVFTKIYRDSSIKSGVMNGVNQEIPSNKARMNVDYHQSPKAEI